MNVKIVASNRFEVKSMEVIREAQRRAKEAYKARVAGHARNLGILPSELMLRLKECN